MIARPRALTLSRFQPFTGEKRTWNPYELFVLRAQSIQIVKQSPDLAHPFAIGSVEQHWAYDLNRPYAETSLGSTKMEEAKSLHWLLDEVSMVTSSVRYQRFPASAMPSTSDCIAN